MAWLRLKGEFTGADLIVGDGGEREREKARQL